MKINAATINLSSSRVYEETTLVKTTSNLIAKKNDDDDKQAGASFSLSEETKKLLRNLEQQNAERTQNSSEPAVATDDEEDATVKTLRALLELLKKMRAKLRGEKYHPHEQPKTSHPKPLQTGFKIDPNRFAGTIGRATPIPAQSTLMRVTTASSFHSEQEMTTFAGEGTAFTEDGRAISFNIELSMTRSFMQETQIYMAETPAIMCDPLVINLGHGVTEMTDQKFLFDIDSDGNEDEISFVSGNSGFLALDKNGDGKIGNGNELFGTKSGDGFKDLAMYDEDGNGFIDENDKVFNKLLIWTKDKEGNDKLISAAKAGVGAIFLGSASTDFSLKNMTTNATNAQIRQTGIFLKEDGGVGTIQHVDIAT